MRLERQIYLTRITATVVVILCAGLLGACSMDIDTYAPPEKKVELLNQNQTFKARTASLTDNALREVVDDYRHYGDGPAELTVTYDPKSKSNTAMNAAGEAARISAFLRKKGVPDVSVDVLPIHDSGEISDTVISYGTVTAQAPEGCTTMGGAGERQTQADKDYKYGCTIQTQIARQIARPKDLQGRGGTTPADGRRQSIIVETYRSGVKNEPIEGETSSE